MKFIKNWPEFKVKLIWIWFLQVVDFEKDIKKAKTGLGGDLIYKTIAGLDSELKVQEKPDILGEKSDDEDSNSENSGDEGNYDKFLFSRNKFEFYLIFQMETQMKTLLVNLRIHQDLKTKQSKKEKLERRLLKILNQRNENQNLRNT